MSRQLPKSYAGVEDDPHQMGGDFVIDERNEFLLVHCSTSSTDRPSIHSLLSIMNDDNL